MRTSSIRPAANTWPPTSPAATSTTRSPASSCELSYRSNQQRSPELTSLLPNYYDIARDFTPPDYQDAVAGPGITGAVACEFGAVEPLAEARWVQRCHDTTGT